MGMIDLKPCPFCGSHKLKVMKASTLAGWNGLDMRVERHTWSVRCNVCKARGGAVGGKVLVQRLPNGFELPPWAITDEKLRAECIEAWNRRAME